MWGRRVGWTVEVGLFGLGGFPRAGDAAGEIRQIRGVGTLQKQVSVWQSGLDGWWWCGVLPVVMLRLRGAKERRSLMGQIRRKKVLNWGVREVICHYEFHKSVSTEFPVSKELRYGHEPVSKIRFLLFKIHPLWVIYTTFSPDTYNAMCLVINACAPGHCRNGVAGLDIWPSMSTPRQCQ